MKKIIIVVLGVLVPFLAHAGALGIVPGPNYLGDTIIIDFDSFASTGASSATTGLATGDIKVYKYCSTGSFSITEFSNSGYTLVDTDGLDVDGRTGFNAVALDTSDGGNSWASGCDYIVNLDSVTIDSQTVRMTARFKLDPNVLSYGTIATGSTTSVAQLGASAVAQKWVARVIWNATTNEKQCITVATDNGSTDSVTFSPNVPTAWSNGDRYKIMMPDAPCYPVTLPSVSGAGGVYIAGFVSAGVADVDSDIGKNHNTFFKNGAALTSLTIDNVSTLLNNMPASVWNRTLEPNASLSAGCILAAGLSIIGGVSPGPSAGVQTYKDPSGVSTRWIGTISGGARSGVAISCP